MRNFFGTRLKAHKAWFQVRRSGKSWSTKAKVSSTASGKLSRSAKFTSKGTYYVRWYVPSAGGFVSATGYASKVTVK